MKRLIVILALSALPFSACHKAPPHLSPQGTVAYNNLQAQKVLDLIRDTVQDGNAQIPPVFTTVTARRVTQWHESALKIMHTAGTGWKATVSTSLDELVKAVPAAERVLLNPYIGLAKSILAGV